MSNNDTWEVNYPEGLIRYIDLFRAKYLQYEIFDAVLAEYIEKHLKSSGKRICSLGSGTGRHEVELSRQNYEIIGIERNIESIPIAEQYSQNKGYNIPFIECDFLRQDQVEASLKNMAPFDIVLLLYIPISISDYRRAIKNILPYISEGGIFVTDFFDYSEKIDTSTRKIVSDIEVATAKDDKTYAVRLNYYEYENNIVNWDAIYLYNNEQGQLQMGRDHDILDITPHIDNVDPLKMDEDTLELLPARKITELHSSVAPPFLHEYLLGWRKIK